jgi:hypothetical protein
MDPNHQRVGRRCCGEQCTFRNNITARAGGYEITSEVYQCPQCRQKFGIPVKYLSIDAGLDQHRISKILGSDYFVPLKAGHGQIGALGNVGRRK